jgi:hypothetical protein
VSNTQFGTVPPQPFGPTSVDFFFFGSGLADGDGEADGDGLALADGELEGLTDGSGDGAADGDGSADGEGDALASTEGDGSADGLGDSSAAAAVTQPSWPTNIKLANNPDNIFCFLICICLSPFYCLVLLNGSRSNLRTDNCWAGSANAPVPYASLKPA